MSWARGTSMISSRVNPRCCRTVRVSHPESDITQPAQPHPLLSTSSTVSGGIVDDLHASPEPSPTP